MSLGTTGAPVGPWTNDARALSGRPADDKATALAMTQRDAFLEDARARHLDAESLARALDVAAASPKLGVAVVVSVRPATFAGRRAWLVTQAWGYRGGRLDRVRVWVVDAKSAAVLASASLKG